MTQSTRNPKGKPNAIQGRKPRSKNGMPGVQLKERPGRPNPYGVVWREMVFSEREQRNVSKQRQMWFPTAEARDGKATEMATLRRNRMMVASLTRAQIDEYRAFKEAAGGVPWPTILAGYHANQKTTGGASACTLTVATAVTDYLALALKQRDEGKLAADSYRHSFQKLTLFSEQFGHLPLDRVATDEIRDWVDDFDEVNRAGLR